MTEHCPNSNTYDGLILASDRSFSVLPQADVRLALKDNLSTITFQAARDRYEDLGTRDVARTVARSFLGE